MVSKATPILSFGDRVVGISGLNPGKMTLDGTNTYLVGTGKRRILIDTGEGMDGYMEQLLKAMKQTGCETLQAVLITHWHHDHVGGIADVQQKFPEVQFFKFMNANSSTSDSCGCSGEEPHNDSTHTPSLATSKGESKIDSIQFESMTDGQCFATEGATLSVLYTPGHTDDHVCFALNEENALFSGDTILGAGSCVFSDLTKYMISLSKLRDYTPKFAKIYPAHGPVVENAPKAIETYISHRNQREQEILSHLRASEGGLGTSEIVAKVYADLRPDLVAAATGNVVLHLRKLLDYNVVCVVEESTAVTNSESKDRNDAASEKKPTSRKRKLSNGDVDSSHSDQGNSKESSVPLTVERCKELDLDRRAALASLFSSTWKMNSHEPAKMSHL